MILKIFQKQYDTWGTELWLNDGARGAALVGRAQTPVAGAFSALVIWMHMDGSLHKGAGRPQGSRTPQGRPMPLQPGQPPEGSVTLKAF